MTRGVKYGEYKCENDMALAQLVSKQYYIQRGSDISVSNHHYWHHSLLYLITRLTDWHVVSTAHQLHAWSICDVTKEQELLEWIDNEATQRCEHRCLITKSIVLWLSPYYGCSRQSTAVKNGSLIASKKTSSHRHASLGLSCFQGFMKLIVSLAPQCGRMRWSLQWIGQVSLFVKYTK